MRFVGVFALCALFPAAPVLSAQVTYEYDALGRLVKVSQSDSINPNVSTTYGHDSANNRTTVVTTGAQSMDPPLRTIIFGPSLGLIVSVID